VSIANFFVLFGTPLVGIAHPTALKTLYSPQGFFTAKGAKERKVKAAFNFESFAVNQQKGPNTGSGLFYYPRVLSLFPAGTFTLYPTFAGPTTLSRRD